MARIPDEEISRLKSEISLERLVRARGMVRISLACARSTMITIRRW